MKLKVSIIIPVYNEKKYIGECLTSLFRQSLKPLEVIVVDDGSEDNSKFKIKKLKRQLKIKNLTVLEQKHQGPGKARNLGARKAKGNILVFPDADMRFDKKYLEKLVKPIERGKAVATFTKEEYVANPENIWSQCWSLNSGWPINLHIDPAMPDEANNFRAIKREVFFKTKGYGNVGYGEDVTVLAQLKGAKAKAVPGAICYHFNPSSLSEVFVSARWMGRGETCNRSLRTFLAFSFLNSLRRGVFQSIRHKKRQFLIFKLVFDFGVNVGMIERGLGKDHAK